VTGTTLSYSGVTTVPLAGVVQTTVTAVDSKGTAISGLPITVASSLNNALSAASVTTGAQGSATISYTATNPGTDKLTFTGGGTSLSNSITISAAAFKFSSPAASISIPVGTKQAVSVTYTSAGTPQVGKTVAFAATAGVLTVANADKTCTLTTALTGVVTTDGNGIATACVSATSASPATIQATLTNDTVAAQATLPVLFVATVPYKLVLQVTPSALSPNAGGSTTQKASVLATVTDAAFNPVSGVTVDFTRCVDPSGGSLSQASAVTSSSGQASVQYIAGASATASNGVLLTASVEGASIAQPACAAGAVTTDSTNNNAVTNNTASITVSQSALFIAMGTGNQITAFDTATYQQTWSVYVTDSNGAAVSNVNLTIKVLPVAYWKGSLTFNTVWGRTSANPICANEDINYNGVLDPGEDFNGDGKLEPGNVIAVATGTAGGTLTTDSTGFASFNLRYAKSYANWVYVNLVASAVVTGTESNTSLMFVAPGAASDYSSQTVAPPGQTSPFGIGTCAQSF
jgi:hypothetical protein